MLCFDNIFDCMLWVQRFWSVSGIIPKNNVNLPGIAAPIIDNEAPLVTNGNTSYPPCAAALGVSHEALYRSSGE